MYTTAEFTPLYAGAFGANMLPGTHLQPAQPLTLPPKTPTGCPACDCPAPEIADCPAPATPETCSALAYKTGSVTVASGLKWWHLLLAGGTGIVIGYGAAQVMKPKKPSLRGYRRRW